MQLIDISRFAQDAPIYPGSPPIDIVRIKEIKNGDPFNTSIITTGSHMGSHADAYFHFLDDSPVTIDLMPLEHYYGPCRVISLRHNSLLTPDDFKGRIDGIERIALKCGASSYLSMEAAQYLIDSGIRTIVTDAWSVAPMDNEVGIHRLLLGARVAPVENVILDHVEDGDYILCAFPIKYKNCDGAPVRAVLIKE